MELPRKTLNHDERIDWLRLIRTASVGPRIFQQLVLKYGSATAALEALPEILRRGGKRKGVTIPDRGSAERELQALSNAGAEAVALCEPGYPAGLAAIADPPPLLFVRGDPAVLSRQAVAIVGARNASSNGRRFAEDMARDLGEAGFVVVSGLARGIDGAAHTGSLPTGTVAAVAGGVDIVYPPEHADLQERIAESGALISEQPVGTRPTARHFPARNRLISGLASGILVVEAARKSGSLITARLALEQGREVFAVPGNPRDPRCHGTNDLIRQGAVLTENAADIVEALQHQLLKSPPPAPVSPAPEPIETEEVSSPETAHDTIVELLAATPTGVDELVRECHMSAAAVQSILLELELAGRIERLPGNRISLIL